VLFGVGEPGGILNWIAKRARLNKAATELRVQALRNGGMRYEADFNQPLIKNKLGIRVAAMTSETEGWRNYDSFDQTRFFGTLKWMITPKTELNIEGERGSLFKMTNRNIIAYDGYTNWVAAGSQLGTTLDANKQVQYIHSLTGTVGNTDWIVLDTNGIGTAGKLMNWRGKTASMQRVAVSGTSTVGENIPINVDLNGNYCDFLPRETSIYGPGFGNDYKYSRVSATLTHAFSRNLFIELAAIRTITHNTVDDPQAAAGRFIQVDTNATYPDGTPNLNAGRPYIEFFGQSNQVNAREQSLRAMLSYTKDLKRLGRHTLAGAFIHTENKRNQLMIRETIVSPSAPNTVDVTNNPNRVWRRTYLGRQLADGSWTLNGVPSKDIVMADWRLHPASGLTDGSTAATGGRIYTTAWIPFGDNTQINSSKGQSSIVMLQSSFWNGRIKTIFGASYETRTDHNSESATGRIDPETGNLDRLPLEGFTPSPTGGGIPFAVPNPIGQSMHGRSLLGSIMFHATDWLSIGYNKAENNGLPSFSGFTWSPDGLRPGTRPPVSRGRSDDVSIKLDLFNRRVFATFTYFNTASVGNFNFQVLSSRGNPIGLNQMWRTLNTLVTTASLTTEPLQKYGYSSYLDLIDESTGRTFDTKTKGFEVELFGNLTDNLRLRLIYSNAITRDSNIGPEIRAYWNRWLPFLESRDEWADQAPLLHLPLNNGAGTIGDAVNVTKEDINNDYILAEGRRPTGGTQHQLTANAFYDFSTGTLRGFTIGGIVRYTSRPVAGYYVTNTSDDLDNPKGYTSEYWGKNITTYSLQVGYKRKLTLLGKSAMWNVRLQVNNLFNNQTVNYTRISRGGTLLMYKFTDPRSLTITTMLRF